MKNKIIPGLVAVALLSNTAAYADTNDMMMNETMMTTSAEVGVMVGGASMVPSKNIVENALGSNDHTTLVAAVSAAGLVDALQMDGPFTVFAPTNDAFAKLPTGTVETLLQDEYIRDLTDILTYHVVAGAYTSANLEDGMMLTTLQGDSLEVEYKNGQWYVGGALIEIADVISSNGVTYVVDSVLMPSNSYESQVKKGLDIRSQLSVAAEAKVDGAVKKFAEITKNYSPEKKNKTEDILMNLIDQAVITSQASGNVTLWNILNLLKIEIMTDTSTGVMVGGASMVPSKNIVENALGSNDHTTLVAAVTAAGLVDALQMEGPFTVFAPTNAAFDKLPEGTVETVLMPENKGMLTDVLTYHVVAGGYLASDLKDGLELTTLQGDTLMFTIVDGIVHINGEAMVETSNVISSNGVTHIIDTVLMPSE